MKRLILISTIFLACFSCKNSSDTSNEAEEAYPTSKLDMITTLENVDDTSSTVQEEAK
ncbi:hypothetical protein [Aurantibacillus circumpalustris]|uniref:hypothetical protein n=1 Tax=Aurantibacillus circumpalustris TaxID=3036359 RepID=UPI00295A9ACC|nr:hypothetical protein [Aurantibacillus circumpalustris]